MEELLSRASALADQAEVFIATAKETPVSFEANRLKQIRTRQSTSVALRLIKKGRVGFASSSRLDNSEALVQAALETTQFGAPAKFEFPLSSAIPEVKTYDPEVDRISLEDMIQTGQSIIDQIRINNQDLLCDGRVNKATVDIRIMNSRGGDSSYRKSLYSIGIDGNLIRGTDILFVEDRMSSCQPVSDAGIIVKNIVRQLDLARDYAKVRNCTCPVIFTPRGVAHGLIGPLSIAFNGKMVLQGASPLGHQKGECIFDKRFSLSDDATLPYRPHSSPVDDEGIPCQCLPLIENGVVSNFFYDLQTAGLAKTKSTGHGSRTSGSLPVPTTSALIIKEGDLGFEEMVEDIKEGLVIEALMGAEQGNLMAGDFSGNVLLGYKIENGKLVGRVKDTMISGNIYRALNQLVALGSRSEWVGAGLRTPPLYFAALSVASKGS